MQTNKKGQQEMIRLNSKAERNSYNKKGQQEMIGFVLIVVLVVVGMLVFLIISLRNNTEEIADSKQARNMLDAIMGYTTDCALVFEPQYQTIEDLFKSSYESKTCKNKEETAMNYLNKSLKKILDSLVDTEANIKSYQLDFAQKDSTGETGQLQITSGSCTNTTLIESAQRNLLSGSDRLIIRLKLCRS